MAQNKNKNLQWGSANRPKVETKLGIPHPTEGSDGDIQVRQTNLGAKLFARIGGQWNSTFLSNETKGLENKLAVGRLELSDKIVLKGANANVVIGKENSTAGKNNVVIGTRAGSNFKEDSSSDNVCIGTNAGKEIANSIAIGEQNVAIGSDAGLNAEYSYNTFLGYSAGSTIATGQNNVFIGHGADASGANTSASIAIGKSTETTGTYAIALGYDISAATNTFVFGESGNIATSSTFTNSGSCSFTFSSDERRKRNIQDANIGLELINKLKTRTFQWKPANEFPEEWHAWTDLRDENDELTGEKEYHNIDTDKVMHGFIAQEVKEVLDEYNITDNIDVWSEDSKGVQMVNENKLIIPLIKSVQELSAKVDAMQVEINNLK